MAISSSSSSSSSDSKVHKCSKQCLKSFKTLQKNYDTEREKHNKAKLEIMGYEIALESLESRILGHEKNELAWGLDEYAIRNKIIESQTTELNTKTSETAGQTNDANTEKPKSAIFHDKKSQKPKLKNVVNTGQSEGKPVWDNTKRVNQQNFSKYPHLSKTFVPSGVLIRTRLHRPSVSTARLVCTARPSVSTTRPVSTARPSVSTARPVCTAKPNVSTTRPVYATRPTYPRMDNVRPIGSCLPIKRSYYTKPAFRPKDLKQDVKIFGVQNITTAGTRAVVNTSKGKLDIDFKKSRWVWRPKGNYLDHVSKDSGSFMLKKADPEILLHDQNMVYSGCSSHMTGNKAYLSDIKITMEALWLLEVIPKEKALTRKGLENQLSHNVKIIRCDNRTEFKNHAMNEFCAKKGIKREFSVDRTPQQNGVAERKNRTLNRGK
ncbi:retrovirus-related pol polyprotein from transposon TNT 1-94 [Tanacetum coccineum]